MNVEMYFNYRHMKGWKEFICESRKKQSPKSILWKKLFLEKNPTSLDILGQNLLTKLCVGMERSGNGEQNATQINLQRLSSI